jgi:hypothetical protein
MPANVGQASENQAGNKARDRKDGSENLACRITGLAEFAHANNKGKPTNYRACSDES